MREPGIKFQIISSVLYLTSFKAVMDVHWHTVRANDVGLGIGWKHVPTGGLVIDPWIFSLVTSGCPEILSSNED